MMDKEEGIKTLIGDFNARTGREGGFGRGRRRGSAKENGGEILRKMNKEGKMLVR